MAEVLSGSLVALLGVLGVWITARVTRQGQEDTRDVSWFDRLTDQVDKLWDEVDDLRTRLTQAERKDGAWFRHVMDWRSSHPDRSTWPTVPHELKDDLD